jgi:hypothetical protein
MQILTLYKPLTIRPIEMNTAMRSIFLILGITLSLITSAQYPAEFKAKIQSILKEFNTNFSAYFRDSLPVGLPETLRRIQPGLLGNTDEIGIFYDSTLFYVSGFSIKADSFAVRKKIGDLDTLLQLSLGTKFKKTETAYHFNQPGPSPVQYTYEDLEINLTVGKFNPTSYIIVLGFRKRIRK